MLEVGLNNNKYNFPEHQDICLYKCQPVIFQKQLNIYLFQNGSMGLNSINLAIANISLDSYQVDTQMRGNLATVSVKLRSSTRLIYFYQRKTHWELDIRMSDNSWSKFPTRNTEDCLLLKISSLKISLKLSGIQHSLFREPWIRSASPY